LDGEYFFAMICIWLRIGVDVASAVQNALMDVVIQEREVGG
jgi:hypothetical protein